SDYAVSDLPAGSVAGGQTGGRPVTIDRSGGFQGPVTFIIGAPIAGITVSFTPASTSGNDVTLVLTAAPNAPLQTGSTSFVASGELARAPGRDRPTTPTADQPRYIPR